MSRRPPGGGFVAAHLGRGRGMERDDERGLGRAIRPAPRLSGTTMAAVMIAAATATTAARRPR